MILDIAIGDAYGRPFEFNTIEYVTKNNNGNDYFLRADEDVSLTGTYTDDAQMSLALFEHLLDDSADGSFSYEKLGKRFVNTYMRDIHGGYSKRITAAMIDASTQTPSKIGTKFFINCQTDVLIDSNGSIMRSVPLGILQNEALVIRSAQMQSLITHCSPAASMGSQIIAITSHYFYYRKHKGDMSYNTYLKYLNTHNMLQYYLICEDAFEEHYKEYKTIPCDANITVGAVINMLFTHKDVLSMLKASINLTGDVDSIASISLGLASLKDDVVKNYSKNLIYNLENEKYGKDYLIKLDTILSNKYPRD